ncbi:hypothetical protein BCV69DRAFT_4810 [Microstroma glucosiphilum]|uniref:RING-type domain-containing protein n=1 Tax=Pseudomicrostroma glucosiphilum TaxID=1684307 RepID=A0A316UK62_9BASI|nr:hypothetical protein BCV69DRAFT_4810 [Pseudomicrostroma glucosiphilum]PWN23615.1 hypothetical protein BCV69DRAFT_4810 [Pseudomicrostroma glucosiphilum]
MSATNVVDTPTATEQGPVGRFEVSKAALAGVIIGCVLVVLVSSSLAFLTKRRVQEHPDLYAPRQATVDQPARTRTQGLTRAVLDTFPTITWSAPRRRGRAISDVTRDPARIEEEIESKAIGTTRPVDECPTGALPQDPRYDNEKASQLGRRSLSRPASLQTEEHAERSLAHDVAAPATENQDTHRLRLAASILSIRLEASASTDGHQTEQAQPETLLTEKTHPQDLQRAEGASQPNHSEDEDDGDESEAEMLCPICVESFEEGDLLRILPCAGRHHYHASCIDVWLLSHSVCPLCRTDFLQTSEAVADQGAEQVNIGEALEQDRAEPSEERASLASASASETDEQVETLIEAHQTLPNGNAGSRSPVPRSGLFAVTLEEYRARRRAMRADRIGSSSMDRFRLSRNRRPRRSSAEDEGPEEVIDTIMALSAEDRRSPLPRERLASSTSRPSSASGRISGLFSVARGDAEQRPRHISLPTVPPPVL